MLSYRPSLVGVVVTIALVATACAAPGAGSEDAAPLSLPDTSATTCGDAAALADSLRPAIGYDYEPAPTPRDLALSASVTFTAGQVTDVTRLDDWVRLDLADLGIVSDNRADGSTPTSIAFQVDPEYATPPIDAFAGVQLLVFAHEHDPAPGGFVADIEGLWLACAAESAAAPVIVAPVADGWPQQPTIVDLVEAILTPPVQAAGETPPLIDSGSAADSLNAATIVGCPHGPSFPFSALDSIEPIEDFPDIQAAIAPFLANEEGQFWPQDGWRVLHIGEESALVVNLSEHPDSTEPLLSFMTVERDGDGWSWAGASSGGDCPLELQVPDGVNEVRWQLDPDAPAPSAESSTINLLINEVECVGGIEIGDRLIGPDVVLTADAVRIAFAATPPPGDAFNCQGNPETPFTVDLGEPLGDRTLEQGLDIGLDLVDFLG